MSGGLGVAVLAAGQGTRMRSALPKVLHRVCGTPMVRHVYSAAAGLHPARIAVVVGHGAKRVRREFDGLDVTFVEQTELLGTADAVRRCGGALAGCDEVLVLNGDSPLLTTGVLEQLREGRGSSPVAFLSYSAAEAGRMGRVLRDGDGNVERIVEAADWDGPAGPAEINAGKYLFEAKWLWEHLPAVPMSAKGEYYLTTLVALAHGEGRPAVSIAADPAEVLDFDDRRGLAEAERILRARILDRHMLTGVTIQDPATTYIDAAVEIEQDVTILPNCYLQGETRIATGAVVGPGSTLRNAVIGRDSRIQSSVVEESRVGERVRMGPFAHLRANAVIGDDCEIGNYAEVKNSNIGRGVKMHHFSFVGDADVGDRTNIAAGIITCNFDGVNKNRTTIGSDVFVGSDTMLIAPVTMGDGSKTGAGTVVTKDVPAGATVVGVPGRILRQAEPGN